MKKNPGRKEKRRLARMRKHELGKYRDLHLGGKKHKQK